MKGSAGEGETKSTSHTNTQSSPPGINEAEVAMGSEVWSRWLNY